MKTERNPDQTRQTILVAAFEEIHRNGFQAASLDAILSDTGLTKGALYHHFPNKTALGHAVVDEVIRGMVYTAWIAPLEKVEDPIGTLQALLREAAENMDAHSLSLGCPLNNLAQEMSPLDEGFRTRIDAIFAVWRDTLAGALQRGIAHGKVRNDILPQSTASMILATMEGCIGMAKNAQSLDLLHQCGTGLIQYLDSLRA
jgi:AcrR family transcriptional regulator